MAVPDQSASCGGSNLANAPFHTHTPTATQAIFEKRRVHVYTSEHTTDAFKEQLLKAKRMGKEKMSHNDHFADMSKVCPSTG